jgi:FG-GAP repeat
VNTWRMRVRTCRLLFGILVLFFVRGASALPNFVQEARLTASDAAPGDFFGSKVALSSDGLTALVGAPGDDCGAGQDCGAAYIFIKTESGWIEQAKLTPSDVGAGSRAGHFVALSGDGSTALVRARSTEGLIEAYVFVRTGAAWSYQATLRAGAPFLEGFPIRSMAISGDGNLVLLGAPYPGAVRVFVRNGQTWTEESSLVGDADTVSFGNSVALSEDGSTALIGVLFGPYDEETGLDTAAYVYSRTGGTWVRQQTLETPFPPDRGFGEVSLSGDGATALLSVPNGGCENQLGFPTPHDNRCGLIVFYVRDGATWTRRQVFFFPVEQFSAAYTNALSGDGSIALAKGARVDVLARNGDSWIQVQSLFGSFAMALSRDGRTALTGLSVEDCAAGADCGAVYVFAQGISEIPTASDVGLILLALLLAMHGVSVLFRSRRAV